MNLPQSVGTVKGKKEEPASGTLAGSFELARLEGFEPPTRGLEGRCSVQLSYRRKRLG